MRDNVAHEAARHVPQMALVTAAVVLLPPATSLVLRATGVVSSPWLSVSLTVGLSLGASYTGSAYWRRRGGTGELLFSELLVWGWVRRWRQEREVANAAELLEHGISAGREGAAALSTERREGLLRQLAKALEGQDVYLNGHSRRVARHATMIARGLGLPNHEVARIRAAAAVHDVGKLLTPKPILNKPGRLTDAEFDVVQRHPVDGAEMVAPLGDHELTRIVRHHHERLDGAGYPDGLAGEQIPLGAWIIAVADTFDAITSSRPYRAAARHQRAIDILRAEAGSQLDPAAVRAFLAYYTGNRPTAVWSLLAATVRRLVSWLTGDPAAAATISTSKLAAATAATVAIGAAAGGVPVPAVHALAPRNESHVAAPAQPFHITTAVSPSQSVSAVPMPARPAHTRRDHAKPGTAHAAVKHTKARSHATSHTVRVVNHATVATPAQSATVSAPSHAKPSPEVPAAATPTPATTTPTTSAPTTSTPTPAAQPTPTTGSGHTGNGNGNGHAHDQGNGRGQGNVSATTTPTASPVETPIPVQVTTPTETTTPTQSQGNGNANGQDNGNANGQGNGHGNGNGKS